MFNKIDEESWIVFGQSKDGLFVDIANHYGDVLHHVPAELAQQIIAAHNEALERLQDACQLYFQNHEGEQIPPQESEFLRLDRYGRRD